MQEASEWLLNGPESVRLRWSRIGHSKTILFLPRTTPIKMVQKYLSQIAFRQAAEWEVYMATQVSQIPDQQERQMAMDESAAAMQLFNSTLNLMQELVNRQTLRRHHSRG